MCCLARTVRETANAFPVFVDSAFPLGLLLGRLLSSTARNDRTFCPTEILRRRDPGSQAYPINPCLSVLYATRLCRGRRESALSVLGVTSPRVRGSRAADAVGRCQPGSIPACAGKPSRPPTRNPAGRVHPRVCGEALGEIAEASDCQGPSPRVRGSPTASALQCPCPGSIPACAGKPAAQARAVNLPAVHPRVCGEAPGRIPARAASTGPSPRVRGSLRK